MLASDLTNRLIACKVLLIIYEIRHMMKIVCLFIKTLMSPSIVLPDSTFLAVYLLRYAFNRI